MENFRNTFLDKAAITISIVCAAQCMLLPLAALTIPSFYLLPFSEEAFHNALLYIVMPISFLALFLGCKKHKSYDVVIYGALGVSTLIVSSVWGHDLFGEVGEIVSTVLGSSVLAFGHIQNQKKCVDSCH